MRIFKILLLVFILSVANGYASKESDSLKDPFSWDFGRAREGRKLKHVFILKNDSEDTLTIKRLNTSCGCAAVNILSTNKILPGRIARIKVTFNTKGHRGRVEQYVYVYTDSPENPVIKFTISAEVVARK